MKKTLSSDEIKKMLKSANFVIGTERTIKKLKLGKVKNVMISSNCLPNTEKFINYYSNLGGLGSEIYKLEYPNDELGVICKKPFSISVLAILKD